MAGHVGLPVLELIPAQVEVITDEAPVVPWGEQGWLGHVLAKKEETDGFRLNARLGRSSGTGPRPQWSCPAKIAITESGSRKRSCRSAVLANGLR